MQKVDEQSIPLLLVLLLPRNQKVMSQYTPITLYDYIPVVENISQKYSMWTYFCIVHNEDNDLLSGEPPMEVCIVQAA